MLTAVSANGSVTIFTITSSPFLANVGRVTAEDALTIFDAFVVVDEESK